MYLFFHEVSGDSDTQDDNKRSVMKQSNAEY